MYTLWRCPHTELTRSPVQCPAGVEDVAKAAVLALMQASEVDCVMSPDIGGVISHSDNIAAEL